MALNISAWSIRNPLPSVGFSIILLVLVSFTKLAVTRLPNADIRDLGRGLAVWRGAIGLGSQVTKTIEDGVSGRGCPHISSSITDDCR